MASTILNEGPTTRISIPAGESSPPIYISVAEAVVVVCPGGGGSMLAQASWSMVRELQAGVGEWADWDPGTVTTKTTQSLFNATAVRFTATAATGIAEIRQ